MNCNACGSTNLIEGTTFDESGGTKLKFKPKKVSSLKAIFGIGIREITAYGCIHCGNLQFLVSFTDEDRQRYLNFEGQQPDLLNRIKSEK